jgi:hypothetical protein
MKYQCFKDNLNKCDADEKIAGERVKEYFKSDIIHYNNDYKYDVLLANLAKIEIKTDYKSLTSPNFFIEYYGYNKPSGIQTTESNYYLINDTQNFYLIETYKLKELLKLQKFKTCSTYDELKIGFLVPKQTLIVCSIKI